MDLSNRNIGYGITGSFCTFAKTRKEIQRLTEMGAHVIPIFSYQTQNCDTRFGTAKEFMEEVCDITGNPGIRTLQEAEPIGPKGYLDVMVIAPCTGNSAAKLANAITDTPVLMAAKAHMRNGKPLVIAISTNDALGASFKNIGMLMNTKHIYFVPFAQDNYEKKPNSMVAKMELLPETIVAALAGQQLQLLGQAHHIRGRVVDAELVGFQGPLQAQPRRAIRRQRAVRRLARPRGRGHLRDARRPERPPAFAFLPRRPPGLGRRETLAVPARGDAAHLDAHAVKPAPLRPS